MAAVRWNTKAMRELRTHARVDEVEDEGMDEGFFFVHLADGWKWADMARYSDAGVIEHCRSFSGAVEALVAVRAAVTCGCSDCCKGAG